MIKHLMAASILLLGGCISSGCVVSPLGSVEASVTTPLTSVRTALPALLTASSLTPVLSNIAFVQCGLVAPMAVGISSKAKATIVWNRQSPVPPPAIGNPTFANISEGSHRWVITDQFRYHGFEVAGAEMINHPLQGALVISRGMSFIVYQLPKGTGAAVITSWNNANANGQKTPPTSVNFATTHGIGGTVRISNGQVTVEEPKPLTHTEIEQGHLASGSWLDGWWYDTNTSLWGPRLVYVSNKAHKATVYVYNESSTQPGPGQAIQVPGAISSINITGIDSSGTVVTLKGPDIGGTLNLVSKKWRPLKE